MQVVKKIAGWWVGVCISTNALASKTLPNIEVSGLDQNNTDPFAFVKQLGGIAFTLVVSVLIAVMAWSMMRNAWVKYHETGEDGSRANMGAVVQQGLAGIILILFGLYVANWGYQSFGI